MSVLSSQVDALREAADEASSLDYTELVNIGWMRNTLAPMLREAADTIISMRDRLQELQGVGESSYTRLFGTPERAARTLANVCQFTHGGELCDRCRCYLFDDCDGMLRLRSEQSIYDALLEWLKSEVRDD